MGARLPAEIEVAVYRIVQEGLTNVLRHAKASTCRIHLARTPHGVTATIEDDGVGFDPNLRNTEAGGGLGLVGIRQRVARLNGTVRIESSPGRGTLLTADIPIGSTDPQSLADSTALAPTVAG
jgi:signal transduction histidine kinase